LERNSVVEGVAPGDRRREAERDNFDHRFTTRDGLMAAGVVGGSKLGHCALVEFCRDGFEVVSRIELGAKAAHKNPPVT
jgi:hypothetical protein